MCPLEESRDAELFNRIALYYYLPWDDQTEKGFKPMWVKAWNTGEDGKDSCGSAGGQVGCAEGRGLWHSEQYWHSPGDSSAGDFCTAPLSLREDAAFCNFLLSENEVSLLK